MTDDIQTVQTDYDEAMEMLWRQSQTIKRLQQENEKLRAALNRIDGIAVSIIMLIDAEHDISANSVLEIRKECRAAAAALKETGE